jgi:hypothetical protein
MHWTTIALISMGTLALTFTVIMIWLTVWKRVLPVLYPTNDPPTNTSHELTNNARQQLAQDFTNQFLSRVEA